MLALEGSDSISLGIVLCHILEFKPVVYCAGDELWDDVEERSVDGSR